MYRSWYKTYVFYPFMESSLHLLRPLRQIQRRLGIFASSKCSQYMQKVGIICLLVGDLQIHEAIYLGGAVANISNYWNPTISP